MRSLRVMVLLLVCCIIGTLFDDSTAAAARSEQEQLTEEKESRRNGDDWRSDERTTGRIADWTGADGCPQDSVPNESGGCKCGDCPPVKCRSGQRPDLVKGSFSGTPGKCCPRYNCIPSGHHHRVTESSCPRDSVLTDNGVCKCVPTCPPPKCRPDQRPVEVRAAKPETPGSCCPLYNCWPSDPISWVKPEEKPQNCIHEGVSRKLGEEWKQSDCITCLCNEDGIASCQMTMCKSCENAIPPDPGECCPHCPSPTNGTSFDHRPDETCKPLDDCKMKCYHGFRTDKNNCPICECADDGTLEVDLVPDVLPEDYKVCPELPYCGLNCDLVKDADGCSVCACQTPPRYPSPNDTTALDAASDKRICPEVKCDLHCERGLVMDENDCTFCECKPSAANCSPLVGCRKRCSFGYKTNKRGCPVCRCRASCTDHLNETHPEGSTWYPNSCTTCTCEPGGRLNCKETICSVACNNPLPPKPDTCCPVCPITVNKENEMVNQIASRGWGTVPITLIVVLALLCLLLIIHIVRSRFRGRLSPSETSYTSYPPQYYKCVPVYDTPVHRNEKIVPL